MLVSETTAAKNNNTAAETEQPALLDVEGLSVTYRTGSRETVAVDDVSFRVGAGERVALVGESGSGKTTLGLAVAGFLTQPGVSVRATRATLGDEDLMRRKKHRLPRRTPGLSMVFQDAMTSLDPVWTVGSQLRAVIRAGERMSRREAADRAGYWLTRVGLTDTRRVLGSRPYELSGGMRQRVMMAIALGGRPRLLIADEPTSALDASLSRDAMELLLELTRDAGTSLLIISHDILLCREYSDRTLVMYGGRLVEQGPSATLEERAAHPYTIGLLRCVPTLDSAHLPELPTLAGVRTGLEPAHGR